MDTMPEPDEHAQQASHALQARIRSIVQTAGGWMGFDRYMHTVLYEPRLGYYTGGAHRFGADGDFVTAPEITPLFGHCLATAIAPWMTDIKPHIVEFGAGTGQLAAQLLNALARLGCAPEYYDILEVSGALRSQQRHTLETLAPESIDRVRWLDQLPNRIDGVVVANEVLDAMPVRLFEIHQGAIFERGLARDDKSASLQWLSRPADPDFSRTVCRALASSGWGGSDPGNLDFSAWPEGFRSEVADQAGGWLTSIGERLNHGVALLIDYGFPAAEFYHPQRSGGTLACHYRHRVHHDPLLYPGLQDITAHVDFSATAHHAQLIGLDVLAYTSQAHFLLNAGLLDGLAQMPVEKNVEYTRQAQAVQTLVSESEMGELFKVILLGSGVDDPGIGFSRGDRSGVLTPNP